MPDNLVKFMDRANLFLEILIVLVELTQLPFNPLTLVDISHDEGVEFLSTHLDISNRGLNGKFSPVSSSGGHAARGPDVRECMTALGKRLQRVVECMLKTLSEKAIEWLAPQLVRRMEMSSFLLILNVSKWATQLLTFRLKMKMGSGLLSPSFMEKTPSS